MSDCLFCKISKGEIPSKRVFEDDDLIAIEDIQPQAPVHLLVIPRRHIASLNDASEEDQALLGKIVLTCRRLAAQRDISAGYRVVNNCGSPAGQSVFHIHFHLLGGRGMAWPPG